jgi:DNA-binding NarL/FixJ family response regulator
MDISMPALNGLKASAKLKRIAPDIKILTVTRHLMMLICKNCFKLEFLVMF